MPSAPAAAVMPSAPSRTVITARAAAGMEGEQAARRVSAAVDFSAVHDREVTPGSSVRNFKRACTIQAVR
eukprot:4363276-Prymnesium_polylepis.1